MTKLIRRRKVYGYSYSHIITYIVNRSFLTIKQYRQNDLLKLHDDFKKNRDFDKWSEIFYPALKGKVRSTHYELYSLAMARHVTQTFIQIMHNELLEKNVEYSFNQPKKEENRFSIRMGYIEKPKYEYYLNKKSIFVYPFSGVLYLLRTRYPKAWPGSFVVKLSRFGKAYRKEVFMQLIKGKRYYNSVKEKILSEL